MKYLADSLVHWARDFGIEGFRCDVGGGIPESFWVEARKALDKVNPEIVLLSESDRPDDQLEAFDINYKDSSCAAGKVGFTCPSVLSR
jgi:cyclomaltodextrinase / maltogenic alpha-amylase / neopullulanase